MGTRVKGSHEGAGWHIGVQDGKGKGARVQGEVLYGVVRWKGSQHGNAKMLRYIIHNRTLNMHPNKDTLSARVQAAVARGKRS